jgi:SAM-dependent methyltransferase
MEGSVIAFFSEWNLPPSIRQAVNPYGRKYFVMQLPTGARVLDVGCGNNSPLITKTLRPDLYYVGLDIADYAQSEASIARADRYILTSPKDFVSAISQLSSDFDAVICAHTIEHCYQPDAVLEAMLDRVARGGRLYVSFPCRESAKFPRRQGLNFFDDPTHLAPPDYERILQVIREKGLEVKFATARYRPAVKAVLGLAAEPMSAALRKTFWGTLALYGFESIICAGRTT